MGKSKGVFSNDFFVGETKGFPKLLVDEQEFSFQVFYIDHQWRIVQDGLNTVLIFFLFFFYFFELLLYECLLGHIFYYTLKTLHTVVFLKQDDILFYPMCAPVLVGNGEDEDS